MPQSTPLPQKPLSRHLLTLYDDFAEYEAYSAFFCDAMAALSSQRQQWLDGASAEGVCYFSQWLKERSASLKGELEAVWELSKQQGHTEGADGNSRD